jgi:hypothetical protein
LQGAIQNGGCINLLGARRIHDCDGVVGDGHIELPLHKPVADLETSPLALDLGGNWVGLRGHTRLVAEISRGRTLAARSCLITGVGGLVADVDRSLTGGLTGRHVRGGTGSIGCNLGALPVLLVAQVPLGVRRGGGRLGAVARLLAHLSG